ncbi:hypothetical protein Tco_1433989 [Tanacetum coccineum]
MSSLEGLCNASLAVTDRSDKSSVGFYEMKMMVISMVRGCDDFTGLDKAEIVRILVGQLIMFAAMADLADGFAAVFFSSKKDDNLHHQRSLESSLNVLDLH